MGPVFFLLFINDLPLSWESRNGLFADYASFYASATILTDVQSQLQRDLNSTAMWTKEHGVVAHPEKTKYMIVGIRQKLSHCEKCGVCEASSRGTPLRSGYRPHPSLVKLCNKSEEETFKRVALLVRIKTFLPIKYRIILFNVRIKPILEYFVSDWASCNVGLLDDIFKVQKRCAHLILDAPSKIESYRCFISLNGYTSVFKDV